MRLLSPQNWSKCYKQLTGSTATQTTMEDRMILKWKNGVYTKMVMLDSHTNVASLNMINEKGKYKSYVSTFEDKNKEKFMCYPSKMKLNSYPEQNCTEVGTLHSEPKVLEFKNPKSEREITAEQQTTNLQDSISRELLEIHNRYGHVSMRRLQHMAKEGQIPKKYATCNIPACKACLFGKSTRRKWRHKIESTIKEHRIAIYPGEIVSVDQLISPTPGLIAQMLGKPTTKRYTCATVYVDQYTDYTMYIYSIHKMLSTRSKEKFPSNKLPEI